MSDGNCIFIDEINLSHNIELISKQIFPKKLYIVCKSNNYGLGNSIVSLFKKNEKYIDGYCVSDIEEAIQLRNYGISKPIVILGIVRMSTDADKISRFNLEFVIPNLDFCKALKPEFLGRGHLAIDVGLGRIGISSKNDLKKIISWVKEHEIKFKGIYTHHSSNNIETIKKECEIFNKYTLNRQEIANSYHSGSSSSVFSGLIEGDIYRVGAAIFGMHQNSSIIQTKSVAKLCSRIAFLKKVIKGQSIGYESIFICPSNGWIANIPLGYGDGFSSRMKNAEVQIGNKIGIIACVCMNQTMIFLKEEPQLNEEVTIVGIENICRNNLSDIVKHLGINNDEFFCQLGSKILRKVR